MYNGRSIILSIIFLQYDIYNINFRHLLLFHNF